MNKEILKPFPNIKPNLYVNETQIYGYKHCHFEMTLSIS